MASLLVNTMWSSSLLQHADHQASCQARQHSSVAAAILPVMQAPVMGGMAGPDSPTLGAGDLHTAKSRLGLAYEKLPKDSQQTSLLGGSHKTATLAEVEVYFAPEIAALY